MARFACMRTGVQGSETHINTRRKGPHVIPALGGTDGEFLRVREVSKAGLDE